VVVVAARIDAASTAIGEPRSATDKRAAPAS
jgi:hypothetical protein